jgi:hypothetical protein
MPQIRKKTIKAKPSPKTITAPSKSQDKVVAKSSKIEEKQKPKKIPPMARLPERIQTAEGWKRARRG